MKFGVHTGLQNTSIGELQGAVARIEDLGFDWISIWDHFYAADGTGNPHCLEAVASHAALAATTSRVRCGSLVYSVGYRHPAVLANAAATLDQLSGGRITLGLGGGWLAEEYQAYGIEFPPVGVRLRQVEEAIQCVRGLLTQDVTSFDGELLHPHRGPLRAEARAGSAPALDRRRWREGHAADRGAPRRRLERAVHLARGLRAQGRGPRPPLRGQPRATPPSITRSVNVGIAFSDEALRAQFGNIAEYVRPGVLTGSVTEMVDRVGAYRRRRGRVADPRDACAVRRRGPRPLRRRGAPAALVTLSRRE